jgi:hypothetical protein
MVVAGLPLSRTICCGHWQRALPLHHCLAASWQRRCRRWLAHGRIAAAALHGPLVRWAIQHGQQPGHSLHLALDTTLRLWAAGSSSATLLLADPHWQRGLSLARIGLHRLQPSIVASGRALLAWGPMPLQSLEPCLPGRAVRRRQHQPWFTRLDLPPPLPGTAATAVA